MTDSLENKRVKLIVADKEILMFSSNLIDDDFDIIKYLNLGSDYKAAIVHDVERFLCAQDHNVELMSVRCTDKPMYYTDSILNKDQKINVSEYLKINFPIEVIVCSSANEEWKININLSYEKTPLRKPGFFSLKRDFIIINHEKI